ncbi:hypothetical protein BDN72DRAFT_871309 [Pluteus cervinus]|uniref:Uncharacterized protein n=1 Tax=Pluteus cervinus TaxID=181527 RepID=A0ACD3AR16_9AGAR|nr:hypothetical protein BDN72DRAFT_871309 [Pluteus cervinus]
MVSFQYKPKLDQHHGRCHTGFDCIDCSKTFNTPAEYKGHTSCISEAEKYQKSLYTGPKTGLGAHGNSERQDRLNNSQNGFSNAGAFRGQNGRGGYHNQNGNGGRYNNGYGNTGYGGRNTIYSPTGANNTPLGTPKRMSPVTTKPEGDDEASGVEKRVEKENKKKRKGMAGEDDMEHELKKTRVDEDIVPLIVAPPVKEKKEKKDKKEKKEKVKAVEAKDESSEKAKKKKKKDDVEMAPPPEESTESTEVKEKKKKKRKDKEKDGVADVEMAAPEESAASDKKKKKKEKENGESKEERKARKEREKAAKVSS